MSVPPPPPLCRSRLQISFIASSCCMQSLFACLSFVFATLGFNIASLSFPPRLDCLGVPSKTVQPLGAIRLSTHDLMSVFCPHRLITCTVCWALISTVVRGLLKTPVFLFLVSNYHRRLSSLVLLVFGTIFCHLANGSKTHKRLKERFLIGRNRTKRANFRCNHLFRAVFFQNAGSQLCFRFFFFFLPR